MASPQYYFSLHLEQSSFCRDRGSVCSLLVLDCQSEMGVSDFVGEKLGLSEPSARFLVALYAGEVLKHAAQYMQYHAVQEPCACTSCSIV